MLDTCPRVRVRSYLNEFPWLEKLGDTTLLDSISVKRADERLMESVPWELNLSRGNGNIIRTGVRVALFDNCGNVLGWVASARYKVDQEHSQVEVAEKGERILKACYRVGADRVHYVVWVEFGYGCYREDREGYGICWRVTLYKPHKSKSVEELADTTWTVEKAFVLAMESEVSTYQ